MNQAVKKDYSQLKALLEEQETFPMAFTYKFIGHNTPAFATSVSALERMFPALAHEHDRQSSGGKHLAKTYVYEAPDVESILEIYRAIEQLQDLVLVL